MSTPPEICRRVCVIPAGRGRIFLYNCAYGRFCRCLPVIKSVCICMHDFTFVHTHARTHTHTHARTRARIWLCMQLCSQMLMLRADREESILRYKRSVWNEASWRSNESRFDTWVFRVCGYGHACAHARLNVCVCVRCHRIIIVTSNKVPRP